VTKPTIETYRNAIFLDLRVCRFWIERLTEDRAPNPPHPQDHRWGIFMDEGETCFYLGNLFVILTPWSLIKKEREAFATRREQLWAELAQ
jgi:hypothetical protein